MSGPADAPAAPGEPSFTCALCHETFLFAWSDEAAEAEYQKVFPGALKEAKALVCDDCYKMLLQLAPRKEPKRFVQSD